MEKKLYHVRMPLYVMAENASGASVAATKAPFDIFECHTWKADHCDSEWENAIPNKADDRTCDHLLPAEQSYQTTGVRLQSLLRRYLSNTVRRSLH